MRVQLGGRDRNVSEHFLYLPHVGARPEMVGGKRVAQRVGMARYPGSLERPVDQLPSAIDLQRMASTSQPQCALAVSRAEFITDLQVVLQLCDCSQGHGQTPGLPATHNERPTRHVYIIKAQPDALGNSKATPV